ncbi:coiled-coil domain-containing protein 39 [Anopheles ziemanni]|uniref:coiled-coil domain-containing protein 39 n=1 Tax=Anopheles coustani TaxID=139045 RepID=UPI00265AA397|nr:coiled-coil domain-containing protein 39 [Anopheles coustani]XP_058174371.1 coiled-coil domain-containing protein 39 [Anopheles ziemanni]
MLDSQPYIIRVMEEMGLADGGFIPIANEENKRFLEYINRLGEKKTQSSGKLQISDQRLGNLKVHLKNAQIEFEHNSKLIGAEKSQISTEDGLLKVASNDRAYFRQQVLEVKKSHSDLEKHDHRAQGDMTKLTANVEKYTESIKWAKGALLEWKQVMGSGEETNKLILKYSKLDTSRAESLEAKRKQLENKIAQRRAVLVTLYEEYKSLEQVLERTSQLFRLAHHERRQLVRTWKEAVKHMNQRERYIKDVEAEIDTARDVTDKLQGDMQAQVEFLEEQQRNNQEIEIRIGDLNVEVSKLRNRLTILNDSVQLKTNEYQVTRKSVQNLSNKLSAMRSRNNHALNEEDQKKNQIHTNLSELEILRDKLDNFRSKSMCAQERLRQLNEMVESEEKQIRAMETETTRLSTALYRAQQQLFAMKEEDKLLKTEVYSTESGIGKIRAAKKALTKEIARQIEISYDVDYSMEKVQARIANMKGAGDRQEEENRVHAKLVYAAAVLAQRNEHLTTLLGETARTQQEYRQSSLVYQQDAAEIERMTGKWKEKTLIVEGGEKKVRQCTIENQERLVEKSLLKMRIKQMERQLENQSDKMYTLERHRMELEAAISKRMVDISAQRNMLQLRRKYLAEERAQLKADITERTLKIDQLKNRYELSLDLLGKNEDGSIVTATQIKIKTAQEKYMLLREGSELNVKILKAEEDLKALENTLKVMNYSNEKYKRGFQKVEDENPDMIAMENIQADYCKAVAALKAVRSDLAMNTENLHDLNECREQNDKALEQAQKERLDSNDVLLRIQKELLDQRTKIQRAERELKLAIKAAKAKTNDDDLMLIFQKDLNLKELEERNGIALQHLADLVEHNSELAASISKHCYERGLRLPLIKRTKSQISWRSENSHGTEYSGRVDTISSKQASRLSICTTTSSRNTDSSEDIAKSFDNRMSAGLSVILIDFPGTKGGGSKSMGAGGGMKK